MDFRKIAAVILVVGFTVLAVHNVVDNQNTLHLKNIQLKSRAAELKTLELKYDTLQIELDKTGKDNTQKLQQLQKEKQQLEQEKARLQQELAVKRSKLNIAATSIPGTATAYAASGWHYDCRPQVAAVQEATARLLGGNAPYANWIFSHESCMDPGRLNSIGCKGLGQSCGHASFTCGPNDIDCQVLWFNNYANGLGGWARAQQIWISKNWW
jgi:hypothetical protein